LANGDITKYAEVADLTYLECLNVLGYYHQRDKKIEYQQRQQDANSRAAAGR